MGLLLLLDSLAAIKLEINRLAKKTEDSQYLMKKSTKAGF